MATARNEEVEFIEHTHCDRCGSSDANARYSDGHTYCFSCEAYGEEEGAKPRSHTSPATDVSTAGETKSKELLTGQVKAIPARGLTQQACGKYGYTIGEYKGEPVHIATYHDKDGKAVAQKLRFKDKRFQIIGDAKAMTLFGSNLWGKGKKLTICEGEIDTITCAAAFGLRWAVVGLPHGAASAVKAVRANWDYIMGFDEIVILMDQDEAGQRAAKAIAEILPVGRAKIASLPCKDVNECLMKGQEKAIIEAVYQAKEYRPDGIVAANDYRDTITVDEAASAVSYPFSMLNEILKGVRKMEMVSVLAGSGVGKSTFVREIAYHLHTNGQRLGMLMLEESVKRTLLGLVGMHINKNITVDRTLASDEEVLEGFDDLVGEGRQPLYLYDSFGANEIQDIANKLRYLAQALECDVIVLDHISLLVSAADGDERRMLDAACTVFRQICQECNVTLILVSHLSRPSGDKGHEAGAAVRLSQARGSHAIAQLSDACIALQVDPDDPDADVRHLRVLKNRFTGQTGDAGVLVYHRESGRLVEEELSHLLEADNDNEKEEGETDVDISTNELVQ